ncbi:MAG: ABC transporter permease subunit [bacterium]
MLHRMRAVFAKEFAGYFNSPVGYIFLVVFLVLSMFFFFASQEFFIRNQATMQSYFSMLPWLFLFFIPAVSMRLWAEERNRGTQEVLLTLPLQDHEVVLGKYFAAVAFIAVALLLSGTLPLTLYFIGKPDWGPIICGYVSAVLLGSAFLAIGIFMSALTNNQILAFLGGLIVAGLFMLASWDALIGFLPENLKQFSQYWGMGFHFQNLGRGVIDTRDVLYYVTVALFFIYVTVRAVQSRRLA